jgi:hypothetical protein
MMRRPYKEYSTQKWLRTAEAKKAAACLSFQRGEKWDFTGTERIWQGAKKNLFTHFLGNCAYCETPVENHPGAVEHFRPKAHIYECATHPGYYWLAYHPKNYLLSCYTCNSTYKIDHFPVRDSLYQTGPSDTTNERPYLLNPYDDWVFDYVYYEFTSTEDGPVPTGFLRSKDLERNSLDEGTESIKWYGLNREPLRTNRQIAQTNEIIKFRFRLQRGGFSEDERSNYIHEISTGGGQFTTARLAAVWAFEDWEQERVLKRAERRASEIQGTL